MVFFRSLSETIIRPYFLGSNAYVLPGVALVLYFYAKLSLGGKKKAIKDDKKGHH